MKLMKCPICGNEFEVQTPEDIYGRKNAVYRKLNTGFHYISRDEKETCLNFHYIPRDEKETGLSAAVGSKTEPSLYDCVDCPECGCQLVIQPRKRAYPEPEVKTDRELLEEMDISEIAEFLGVSETLVNAILDVKKDGVGYIFCRNDKAGRASFLQEIDSSEIAEFLHLSALDMAHIMTAKKEGKKIVAVDEETASKLLDSWVDNLFEGSISDDVRKAQEDETVSETKTVQTPNGDVYISTNIFVDNKPDESEDEKGN